MLSNLTLLLRKKCIAFIIDQVIPLFPSSFHRSKSKSPPQDVLLKLEKESKFKEAARESSIFVFKLGVSNLRCCLLMNGLVYESSEVSS